MRIAHILSSFGMGGQERVALDLAVGQRALGHDVTAVSLAPAPDGPLAEEFRDAGVEVSRQPKRGGFDPTMPVRLGRLFRRTGIDVVHTHNPQPLIYAAPAARAARAALVHTKHGMNPDASSDGWARSRRRWLRRTAAGMVDAFVAVSEHTAGVAREAGESPRGPVHVIPNGIDLSRFFPDGGARAAVRDELGIPRTAYVVGTVGRLFVEKGHDFLLRAVDALLSPEFHLVVVGDGPRAEALAGAVRGMSGAASVHLLGARRDVPRLVAAFDTFVLSSVREGLPLVIPEAMAAGLPVVATSVGGIPKVVDHGRTGYLVTHDDVGALGRRLDELDRDRDLAKQFGERGREVALAHYSAEAMVGKYMELYQASLDSHDRRRA